MNQARTSTPICWHFFLKLSVCLVLLCSVCSAGCLWPQPQNKTTALAPDPLKITHTHYYDYNGTSVLTGIITNKGTASLTNVSLQADGYTNSTLYQQGYASSETGIKSVILPGASSPFMIKLKDIAAHRTNATSPALSRGRLKAAKVSSASPLVANKMANRSTSVTTEKLALRYRIKPEPGYTLSDARPYPFSIINGKAAVFKKNISVNGEVYNGGGENVTSTVVAAVFYQKDGTVLGVFTASLPGTVNPKRTAAFQIDVPKATFPTTPARTEVFAYKLTS